MALTGEEFDQILERLEVFMEQVAKSYLEKRYDIDASGWDKEAFLILIRQVLKKEQEEYDRKQKALDEFLANLPKPEKEPNSYTINKNEVQSNTYDDDPFTDSDDELYDDSLVMGYSFGEMLDELIYCETCWRRNNWKTGIHVRLFEIPGKSRLIVKGNKGYYQEYIPSQDDLMSTDWDFYETER